MSDDAMFGDRMTRVRSRMSELGVDALVLSVGPELPYLTGYDAMPLERLTALVVRGDDPPALLVPRLEAPRVIERPDVFELESWDETDDPIGWLTARLAGAEDVAVGDRTWARFLVELLSTMPAGTTWHRGNDVVGPVRAVKDADEIAALQAAGAAADRVAAQLQGGDIPLVGQTEATVSAELGRRLVAEGHDKVNFAIVAAGVNASSPHHEPDDTVIRPGDGVLCDFGGTMAGPGGVGYCSDMTRVVVAGGEPNPDLAEAYATLRRAHAAGVAAATVGAPCEAVDAAARAVLTDAGYGDWFIHRTGHGIGVEEHEDPYMVSGNQTPLVAGHAFSVEPGVYPAGEWGIRLEDIVVATDDGPLSCNNAPRDLVTTNA